jgi:hypothetical protein
MICVHLYTSGLSFQTDALEHVKNLAQVHEIFETLEEMRANLQETLKEAATLQRIAIEEEVLIGAESINKTCNNMLRDTKRIENRLKHSQFVQTRRH